MGYKQKAFIALINAVLSAPVALAAGAMLLGWAAGWGLLIWCVLCAAAGFSVSLLLGRARAGVQLAAALAAGALCAWALPLGLYIRLGGAVVGALLCVWCERACMQGMNQYRRVLLSVGVLAACLVAAAVYRQLGEDAALGAQLAGALNIITALWLPVALLAMNRYTMVSAARAQESLGRLPARVSRAGAAGSVAAIALMYLAVSAPTLRRWVVSLGGHIKRALAALLQWLFADRGAQAPLQQNEGGPDLSGLLAALGGERRLGGEMLAVVLGIIVFIGLFIGLLYLLYRKIPQWAAAIRRFFASAMQSWRQDGADYTDHSEKLLTLKQAAQALRGRMQRIAHRLQRPPTLAELPDNTARIRYLYGALLRRLRQRGWPLRPGVTPSALVRELGGIQTLGDAYNTVRYAQRSVDDDTVRQAQTELKNV